MGWYRAARRRQSGGEGFSVRKVSCLFWGTNTRLTWPPPTDLKQTKMVKFYLFSFDTAVWVWEPTWVYVGGIAILSDVGHWPWPLGVHLWISMAWVAPLAPSGQCSNVISVPAPTTLFPASCIQCLWGWPCPFLHHSSLGPYHSRHTVNCFAFILSSPPPPAAVGFPAVFPPCGCLLCSLLSSGSNSAWHLEDAWQTLFEQSNPIACAGLQLLVCFLPFVDIAVPWYPWRFRSRTSCRHQSPWMLRLLT